MSWKYFWLESKQTEKENKERRLEYRRKAMGLGDFKIGYIKVEYDLGRIRKDADKMLRDEYNQPCWPDKKKKKKRQFLFR